MIKSLLALAAVALLAVTSAQGQSYPSEGTTYSHGSTLKVDNTGLVSGLVRTAYLGAPLAANPQQLVTPTSLQNGAYTLAAQGPQPDVPRNVTVTITQNSAPDTLGTVVIVGTDASGAALTETITPTPNATVAGLNAFKTITSVTSVGWAANGPADAIKVGYGNKLGLPYAYIDYNPSVSVAILGTAIIAAPTTGTTLPLSTVDASAGTYDGVKKLIVYTH